MKYHSLTLKQNKDEYVHRFAVRGEKDRERESEKERNRMRVTKREIEKETKEINMLRKEREIYAVKEEKRQKEREGDRQIERERERERERKRERWRKKKVTQKGYLVSSHQNNGFIEICCSNLTICRKIEGALRGVQMNTLKKE